jgi:hypothetical protein
VEKKLTECPVCRSPVFGQPDRCTTCETPLVSGKQNLRGAVLLSLIFPGLGHLKLGYVFSGTLIILFSFLLLGGLVIPFLASTAGLFSLAVAVMCWLGWLGYWVFRITRCRPRLLSVAELSFFLLIFLILINGFAFIYWAVLIFFSIIF